MFDIGWSEMLVVGVVALIVVGPKDLPKMFHTLGQVTGKARGMAREFQRAMDDAAKEAGVKDIVKDFKRNASGQGLKEAAGLDDIEKEFRDIGHDPLGKTKPARDAKGKPVLPPSSGTGPKPVSPVAIEDVAEAEDDEIDAQDLARRNAELSATEAERLKKAKKAAEARQQAAVIRAKREAAAAEQQAEPRPETQSAAPQPKADS